MAHGLPCVFQVFAYRSFELCQPSQTGIFINQCNYLTVSLSFLRLFKKNNILSCKSSRLAIIHTNCYYRHDHSHYVKSLATTFPCVYNSTGKTCFKGDTYNNSSHDGSH